MEHLSTTYDIDFKWLLRYNVYKLAFTYTHTYCTKHAVDHIIVDWLFAIKDKKNEKICLDLDQHTLNLYMAQMRKGEAVFRSWELVHQGQVRA